MFIKPLTDDTLDDAKRVICDRFPETALVLIDKEMRNPKRFEEPCAGYISYDDDNAPAAFEAIIIRDVYFGLMKWRGGVGGMTCIRKDAPVESYIDVSLALKKSKYLNSEIGFGNSLCQATYKMAKKRKGAHFGPKSCEVYAWRAVRPLSCLMYAIRRKVLKRDVPDWPIFSTLESKDFKRSGKTCDGRVVQIRRATDVDSEFFDTLMAEYLKTNTGLVLSRSGSDIEWLFGERIRKGTDVLLQVFEGDSPIGYIIVGSDAQARRWRMVDWFAVRNDKSILEALLKTACEFLRRHTPAMMLDSVGFPTFIQPVLRKYLPHERPFGCNCFTWGSKKYAEQLLPIIDTEASWFFGPYDGDYCW